jgi:hypothetical protein
MSRITPRQPNTAALRKAHQKTRKPASRRMTILTRYAGAAQRAPQQRWAERGPSPAVSGIRVVSVVRSYLN